VLSYCFLGKSTIQASMPVMLSHLEARRRRLPHSGFVQIGLSVPIAYDEDVFSRHRSYSEWRPQAVFLQVL